MPAEYPACDCEQETASCPTCAAPIVGRRLRARRIRLGLAVYRVAPQARMTTERLHALECGRAQMTALEAVRLCRVYSYRPGSLLRGLS